MKKKLIGIILNAAIIVSLITAFPTTALAESDVLSTISTGTYHTMVIKADGSLWGWGWNYAGELGDGTTTDRVVPTKVMDNVESVSAGWHYTMAVYSG